MLSPQNFRQSEHGSYSVLGEIKLLAKDADPVRSKEALQYLRPLRPAVNEFLEYSTEVLQFSLAQDWEIKKYSKLAAEQFFAASMHRIGSNLRECLLEMNSSWESSLLQDLSELAAQEHQLFLPWKRTQTHGMGWGVYLLQVEHTYQLSLVPMMCPSGSASLAEESLSMEVGSVRRAMRQLFLRTQQQESRFRYFVRHLPGAHFTQDADLRFTMINSALENLMGGSCAARLQQPGEWLNWVHPSDRDEVLRNLKRCEGANLPISYRFRILIPGSDRVVHLMELRIPVRGIDGELSGFEGLWLDLTREELAQQRLQHAEWKQSLAQVSGSLSHDFNNLLGGLCGMSELVLSSIDESDSNHELITIINNAAQQAKDLIGRIIKLNREERGQVGLHDLCEILRQQQELVRIVLPKDATLELDFPADEMPVRVDPVAIRRIVLNFATNARDVLEQKGAVRMAVKRVELSQYDRSHLISAHCPSHGPAVEFVFKDNGCGIDSELIGRIFGAYFSTKGCSSDSGSGLGLYCLTQFARENGFDYGVRSRLGEGTEMVLLLPLAFNLEGEEMMVDVPGNIALDLREQVSVALYGSENTAVNGVLAALEKRGVGVRLLASEAELFAWLEQGGTAHRALLMSFAYDERATASDLCELMDLNGEGLLPILSLQGLDPDLFSHLIGSKFDSLLMANSEPSACVSQIIDHLLSASV